MPCRTKKSSDVFHIDGRLVSSEERRKLVELIKTCSKTCSKSSSCPGKTSIKRVCEIFDFCERKYYNWLKNPEDGRLSCERPKPKRALSDVEKDAIVARYSQPDVRDLSLREAHLALVAGGEHPCSLSTVQRIFRERGLTSKRGNAHKCKGSGANCAAPQYLLEHPCQVVCWDITYLDIKEGNRKAYCFTAIDAFSRYIIASEVYQEQTALNAVNFITLVEERVKAQGVTNSFILHSDNGSQMRSRELEEHCFKQGIALSFSRPAKSDDNAIIESTFRTLKHTLGLRRSFPNFGVCRQLAWYAVVRHNSRPHSSLNDVTPQARFHGNDLIELAQRESVLKQAQERHPERFVNGIRNNAPVGKKVFNPHGRPPADNVV